MSARVQCKHYLPSDEKWALCLFFSAFCMRHSATNCFIYIARLSDTFALTFHNNFEHHLHFYSVMKFIMLLMCICVFCLFLLKSCSCCTFLVSLLTAHWTVFAVFAAFYSIESFFNGWLSPFIFDHNENEGRHPYENGSKKLQSHG